MTAPSRADVEVRREEHRVRLVVSDEIDLANASDLEAKLHEAVDNETTEVEFDLADVTYLDSAGLQVLYRMTERLRLSQIRFLIVAPSKTPARFAIEMAGMASVFPLSKT